MESIATNIRTSPKTPPRTKKNSTPLSRVPPPPSKRRAQHTPIRGGSSPAIGKTQSLSYYLEATANGELDEWEAITQGLCVVTPDPGSPVQDTSGPVPETSAASASSQPSQPSSVIPPLTNAQCAAQIAQQQSLNAPSAEVFLNLYEAMRTSLAADFRKQYENYQIIISGYQHSNMVKLEDAQRQNTKLRERLVTLEKMRGEERGYWEAEKKHLILRLEKGEGGLDREERLRREEEERRRERDKHDTAMRKLVEKYEAKKKIWAKEKEDIETEKNILVSKVTELDEENKRLENIITNDDNVLLEQLGVQENEKDDLMATFDEERERWETTRVSLEQELLLARQKVERLKNERGMLYWDTKKTLTDVQRENETLNEMIGELTRRIEWQQKTWDKEKSVMMSRLQEERNNVTALRQQLYDKESKRKREGVQEEDINLYEERAKKSRVEAMADSEEEQDEEDEAEVKHIEDGYQVQEYDEVDPISLDEQIECQMEEEEEEKEEYRGSEERSEDGSDEEEFR